MAEVAGLRARSVFDPCATADFADAGQDIGDRLLFLMMNNPPHKTDWMPSCDAMAASAPSLGL